MLKKNSFSKKSFSMYNLNIAQKVETDYCKQFFSEYESLHYDQKVNEAFQTNADSWCFEKMNVAV